MAKTPGTPASDATPNASLGDNGAGAGGGSGLGGASLGQTDGGIGAATGTGETYDGGDMGLEAGAALASGTTTPLDTAGPVTSGSAAGGSSGAGAGEAAANRRAEARSRFNAALEEARAGLEALRADAAERGASYRAKAAGSTTDWVHELKTMSGEARKRAEGAASQSKTRASDGLSSLGKALSETASVIDERLGAKYGDYARSAARSIQESAARLDSKEVAEIGDDVRDFVRKSPGTAIGIAAVTGFFIARLLGVGSDKD